MTAGWIFLMHILRISTYKFSVLCNFPHAPTCLLPAIKTINFSVSTWDCTRKKNYLVKNSGWRMDDIDSHVIWNKFACIFHADTVKNLGFFRQCKNRNYRSSRVERMKKACMKWHGYCCIIALGSSMLMLLFEFKILAVFSFPMALLSEQ